MFEFLRKKFGKSKNYSMHGKLYKEMNKNTKRIL